MTTDLTWRLDYKKRMVNGRKGEYLCNIVQILFNMIPGDDAYEPERGLNIRNKLNQPYVKKSRDTDYEAQILQQFTTYTDLIPYNILATNVSGVFYIAMTIDYEGETYQAMLDSETNVLQVLIKETQKI